MIKYSNLQNCATYSPDKISTSNLDCGSFVSTDNLKQNKQGKEKAIKLPPKICKVTGFHEGDTLIANIRPYLKKIWYAKYSGGASPDVLTIRAKEGYSSKYIYYNLLQDAFFKHVMCGWKGAKMPRGDKRQILNFPIPARTLHEQKKITKVLFPLDEKIELNNRINAELEGMAKLLYDYWFVQFEFPITADQAAAMGKPHLEGKPYKSSGGPMTHNPTLKRNIPEGWDVHDLGDLVNITRGASPRPIDEYLSHSGIPWIKISDATKQENRFILKTKQCILEKGRSKGRMVLPETLILSNSATPAIPRIVKIHAGVHDGWLVIDNYTHDLTKEFMYHYFTYERPRIICMGSGSIFKNLKTDYVKRLKLTLPPSELLNTASSRFKAISDQLHTTTKQNQHLTSLRDWLLPMLMNGQVTVK